MLTFPRCLCLALLFFLPSLFYLFVPIKKKSIFSIWLMCFSLCFHFIILLSILQSVLMFVSCWLFTSVRINYSHNPATCFYHTFYLPSYWFHISISPRVLSVYISSVLFALRVFCSFIFIRTSFLVCVYIRCGYNYTETCVHTYTKKEKEKLLQKVYMNEFRGDVLQIRSRVRFILDFMSIICFFFIRYSL